MENQIIRGAEFDVISVDRGADGQDEWFAGVWIPAARKLMPIAATVGLRVYCFYRPAHSVNDKNRIICFPADVDDPAFSRADHQSLHDGVSPGSEAAKRNTIGEGVIVATRYHRGRSGKLYPVVDVEIDTPVNANWETPCHAKPN